MNRQPSNSLYTHSMWFLLIMCAYATGSSTTEDFVVPYVFTYTLAYLLCYYLLENHSENSPLDLSVKTGWTVIDGVVYAAEAAGTCLPHAQGEEYWLFIVASKHFSFEVIKWRTYYRNDPVKYDLTRAAATNSVKQTG